MPEIAPYRIYHVQLDERDISSIAQPEVGNRYYFVFWWVKIPLGHLYIEEGGSANFAKEIMGVIIPTLRNYDRNNQQINDIIKAHETKDIFEFSKLIEKILSPYLLMEIPDKVDISVIVCTRNRSESLKNCLNSLNEQICMAREIIVVDNAPLDDSTRLVAELYETVSYCKEPRPGLDIARNTGARLAKFPIVAYTDDDVRVDLLWSYRIWETFLQENIDAMTGLVIASSLETESQQIFEKNWGFNKGYQDIFFNNDFIRKSLTIPKVWEIGAGANMAFRKRAIEKVNYFDDRLDVGAAGCSGDSEIWYRILTEKMSIHYNPRAFVYHEHRRGLKQLHKQLFGYMRGHSASVLIQHYQDKKIGYKHYLYYEIPRYYFFLILIGFPNYKLRYQTIWSEIRGLISGIRFYNRNKKKPPLFL
ncbi:glycosyltransferase family 2 protein [Gillisia limnaea]|uniref:Glycosyl transferase family 2 n=1 Tax=Gillisia limnaea (strain DSM 15749 / LMG 21470 / R-8282) TaxID=865937 RepID=H2BT37_GILLR|nr:glycosyltransferase family 2 protein [Gillisia limnaea]EHQ02595.1 glycosyl transferase family 2 [Gillisia limnaea DSM 15749]